jgi:hypothetical protein
MNKILLFISLLFLGLTTQAQVSSKKLLKELKKVYTKSELETFKMEYGSLDILFYAYDHAVFNVNNNGGKETSALPIAAHSIHFTDFGVKLLPYNQYFSNENPEVIVAVKSIFMLQYEMKQNASKSIK